MPIVRKPDFTARKKAAWISFAVSFFVLGLKIFAYRQTHSTAILSDAMESIANVVTAIIALFVISYASQPADRDHPYGHGKAEYFSASFEGGLIFFAALMILVEGYRALMGEGEITSINTGLLYIGMATALNLLVGIYLRKVGTKDKSEALIASGAHLLSDVKTTVGVAVGLLIVKYTGWQKVDALFAMGVGFHLLYEGSTIIRRSFAGLIDAVDMNSLEILSKLIQKYRVPGIIELHHMRAIRAGSFHHIDVHIVVPEYWDVKLAHQVTQHFEMKVVREYPYEGEFAFHLDPCQRSFCKKCDMPDCPIRVLPFEQLYSFSASDLIKGPEITNEPDGSLPETQRY